MPANVSADDNREQVATQSPPERTELSAKMKDRVPVRKGGVALELFGGRGDALAANMPGLKHIAVEQEEDRVAAYKKRHPGSEIHHGKWEKILPDLPLDKMDLCLIDVDPYGEPFKALDLLASTVKLQGPCMLFTTFGFMRFMFQGVGRDGAIKKLCSFIEHKSAWKAERLLTLPAVRCVLTAHLLQPPVKKGFWSSIFGL